MTRKRYELSKGMAYEWAMKYSSASTYLSRLNNCREKHARYLWFFCKWANVTPDQLLDLRADRNKLDAERLLDNFAKFDFSTLPESDTLKDLPNSLKWHSCYAVRALFRENYRELESAAGKYEYSTQKPQRTPSKEQRLKLFF